MAGFDRSVTQAVLLSKQDVATIMLDTDVNTFTQSEPSYDY